MLADALRKYASLSEDEIIRGLTAMGGALLEFSAVLSILNKFAGGKALFGAAGILVASLALDEISENLEKMGNLSWDQIGRGLAAMGALLRILVLFLGCLANLRAFQVYLLLRHF